MTRVGASRVRGSSPATLRHKSSVPDARGPKCVVVGNSSDAAVAQRREPPKAVQEEQRVRRSEMPFISLPRTFAPLEKF